MVAICWAANKQGYTNDDLHAAAAEKFAIVRQRKYPKFVEGEAFEHIRT